MKKVAGAKLDEREKWEEPIANVAVYCERLSTLICAAGVANGTFVGDFKRHWL